MTTFMSQKDKETWEYLAKTLQEVQWALTNAIDEISNQEVSTIYLPGLEKIKKCRELVDERLRAL